MARILVVEADPSSRERLERALEAEGLDVLSASDAEAAWEAFTSFAPGAAVLGRRLPRIAAEDLASRLQDADPAMLVLGATEPLDDMARRLRVRLGAPAPRALPPAAPVARPGSSRVLDRPPLEAGDLGFGALPDLLVRLWRAAADGIVAVDHPGGSDQVLLLRGAPVAVRLAGDGDARDVAGALASLCARGASAYAVHPGNDFAPEVSCAPLPALAPLLAGLRLAADEPSYEAALSALGDEVPVRSGAFASLVRELGPEGEDGRAVAVLGGGLPVRELLELPGRPASLLWFLVRAGALELPAAAPARAAPERALRPGS